MIRIDPDYLSVEPNNGDLFTITCSRLELMHIKDAMELAVAYETNTIAEAIIKEIARVVD